jgi:transposase
MLRMVDKEFIRKQVLVKGWSIRKVAKEMQIARQTVRKYLEDSEPPVYRQTKPREAPVLAEFKKVIESWLEQDEQSPPKQRHTSRRIYQRLVAEYGFQGGESTVRAYVASLRGRRREVFVPLAFEMGQRAQCDWGQAQVIVDGKMVTVHLFCMRLLASKDFFVTAFLNEREEAFLEGHRLAFEFWGGVPVVISYDNLTTAVSKILTNHDRIEQRDFSSFKAHYLFDSHFCTPAKGNEKGSVENLVGYARRNFLVPIPEVRSIEELNKHLLDHCMKNRLRQHPFEKVTIGMMFAEEQKHMLALPAFPYDCARLEHLRVNSLSLIHVDTNRYSVPTRYAYQQVVVKVFVDKIRVFFGQDLIAEHPRLTGRNQESLHFDHYLDLLERKPGAVPYARILKPHALPPLWQQYWQVLRENQTRPERDFIRTLQLLREMPAPCVEEAVQQALATSTCGYEVIRNLAAQRWRAESLRQPLTEAAVSHLPHAPVAPPDVRHYNQLLEEVEF